MLPLIRERCRRAPAPRARRASTRTRASWSHSTRASHKSFAEFAAFDLALDEHAVDTLVRIRHGIAHDRT